MDFGDTLAVLYRAFCGERLILHAKGSFYLLICENVVKIFEERGAFIVFSEAFIDYQSQTVTFFYDLHLHATLRL